jgi:hypothetical protein
MASISTASNGRRTIFFVLTGKRDRVRIGRVSMETAKEVCRHIESLCAAVELNASLGATTEAWLATIPDKLRRRLVKLGLIEPPTRHMRSREAIRIACDVIKAGRIRLSWILDAYPINPDPDKFAF